MAKFWIIKVVLLLLLLELRLLVPQILGLLVAEGRLVKVIGNIDKIQQNVSNCKVGVGMFLFEIEPWCEFSQGDRIRVIGRTQRGVIETLMGQIRLRSATIDLLDINEKETEGDDHVPGIFTIIREKIRHRFMRLLPAFEAGLVSGMVTGDKDGLSKDAYKQMVDSGTIHIVVASGYNVMLVAGAVMSLLFWVCRRPVAVVISLVVVLMYGLLSGGEAPVVRAAIMIAVLLLGEALGRRSVSWWALLLAGWVMVMIEPEILMEVSFQLSMTASVGLMVVYPQFVKYFVSKNNILIDLLDKTGMLTTMATMMTTAPVIWWHFSRVSFIGLLSNTLILPMVGVIMILGVITLVVGGVTAPFLYAAAHWVVVVIETFAKGKII